MRRKTISQMKHRYWDIIAKEKQSSMEGFIAGVEGPYEKHPKEMAALRQVAQEMREFAQKRAESIQEEMKAEDKDWT